ncbi:MAG: hypothetical protein JXB62_22700 [Pirellulales bacterium]|nr:hypothetical protein [Pirellulales bacterium]
MKRRDFLHYTALGLLAGQVAPNVEATGNADDRLAVAASKGRRFLASLFDSGLGLLPEYQGARVFWLFHDNYLAAKVLENSHADLSDRIQTAIRSFGVTESGKIEIVFDEAKRPLPFRHPELVEVKRLGDRIIKTEVLTDQELKGWEDYADLLLLASMSLSKTDVGAAKRRFNQALALWDGTGLKDRVTVKTGRYAVYKLALAVITACRLKQQPTTWTAIVERLFKQQAESGGWITDYGSDGRAVGLANVETSSLAVLALDSVAQQSKA